MLSTIKKILKDTATAQGLNFAFVSFKEINSNLENFQLNISTILVNSDVKINQVKTQGNAYNQEYELKIACIRKREVEESDDVVFDTIIAVEPDFLTYLNTVSQSPLLNKDLGEIKLSTIYFNSSIPTAGLTSTIKMKTFCQQI